MRRKYIIILSILLITLLFSIGVHTTYSLWKISNRESDLVIQDSGCVEIIYSDDRGYNLIRPASLSDSDAKMLSARTISINNYCDYDKNIELAMKVLNTSTIESSKIKIFLNGDVNVDATMLNQFKLLDNQNEDIKEKRLLYKNTISAGGTIRLNIRMWLDSQSAITEDKNSFYTEYYVTTEEQKIKMTVSEKVLQDNGGIDSINSKNPVDYSNISTIDDGVIKVGESYYYRGNVLNNYLKLGDKMFRVVAVNSDKSLKIVYVNNELYSKYNNYSYKNESVGFKDSDISNFLNSWYQENLASYDQYIINYNYCNDTSYTTYYSKILYGALNRVYDNNNPSLECVSSDKDYGGIYTGKVGLLTADEIVLAGGNSKIANSNFYLYTGSSYYTMSPFYSYYGAYIFALDDRGTLNKVLANYNGLVLPVVNLDSKVNLKGSGTINDPYLLDIES